MPRPGTTHARGYGHAHRKRVAELKRDMIDGQPCARGGEPLYLWQRDLPAGHPRSLHGDHVETPRALGGELPDALSCAHHNTQHGARLGNRMRAHGLAPAHRPRASRRLAPPDPPTSRTW